MPINNALMERLALDHPIIQAPLAGGGDTPDLVAASGEAGAIGAIGGAYLTPDQITEAARQVKNRTNRGFGVNLFAPMPAPDVPAETAPAIERVAPFFAELGLPEPSLPPSGGFVFTEQLAAALETGAAMFSFSFGVLPPEAIAAIKAKGMFLMGTATNVVEAATLERAGVEAIVAQGAEAGGHRATFSEDFDTGMIGTMSLVPQVVDAVEVPVVASGGIMDGRGIAAALTLGASAVQLGTAFLTCDEAGIPDAYKTAILNASVESTRMTRAFSGRPARGILNRFMDEVDDPSRPQAILPFPYQNALTRPLRSAAAKAGRAEYLSLWAGQGIGLSRRMPAKELIAHLAAETEKALRAVTAEFNERTP